MAILPDATASGQGAAGTTITFSHTCAVNAVLIVSVGAQDGVGVATVTYDGVAMTQVDDTNTNMRTTQFVLLTPNSGAHNVVVTKDNGTDYAASSISFTGAGGVSATNTANGNSASASGTITLNTATTGNGYVVSALAQANNPVTLPSYTGAGTQFVSRANGTDDFASSYTAFAAGGNVTDSWTWVIVGKYSIASVEVYEAAAAATGGFFFAVKK